MNRLSKISDIDYFVGQVFSTAGMLIFLILPFLIRMPRKLWRIQCPIQEITDSVITSP